MVVNWFMYRAAETEESSTVSDTGRGWNDLRNLQILHPRDLG